MYFTSLCKLPAEATLTVSIEKGAFTEYIIMTFHAKTMHIVPTTYFELRPPLPTYYIACVVVEI